MAPDSPAGRPARVDQRRNDEQILEAAAILLARDPGASMQAIADAAGLTRLTVYRHYSSRKALEESLLAAIDARAEAIIEALPGWEMGIDTLRALITALADLVKRYPIIMARHQVEAGARRSAVDGRLSEVLRQGQTAGVLGSSLEPDILNATLFAVLTAHARLRPELGPPELADGVTDLLLNGLTVSEGRAPPRPPGAGVRRPSAG